MPRRAMTPSQKVAGENGDAHELEARSDVDTGKPRGRAGSKKNA